MEIWGKDKWKLGNRNKFLAKKKESDWGRRFLQFDFLTEEGLLPKHKFLDIGCTWLRGGMEFIKYLDQGNYYGIEKSIGRITLAGAAIYEENVQDKEPTLGHGDDYDLSIFDKKYDFMLANSVFTHILPGQIKDCLIKMRPYLKNKRSKFFATYFESQKIEGIEKGMDDKGYYVAIRYPLSFFEDLADETGYKLKSFGSWGQIQDQKMLLFKVA